MHGMYTISNTMALHITLSDDGDSAFVTTSSTLTQHPRWQEIKYDQDANAFVTYHGKRHHLSDFMRVAL